jgi:hypothetical protein
MHPASQSASEHAAEMDRPVAWQTEGLRVTAFGSIIPNKWKDIVGLDPDQTVTQSPPRPSFEAGPYRDGRLVVSVQVGRCDIGLSPDPTSVQPNELLHLKHFEDSVSAIIDGAHKAFKPDATSTRLAFASTLVQPVASLADGLTILKSILRIFSDFPEHAEEILFQINIPSTIELDSTKQRIKINRLLRWSTGVVQVINVTAGLGAATQLWNTSQIPAVRLEIDVNTAADLSIVLSHDQMMEIVDALAAQVRGIGKSGGLPG